MGLRTFRARSRKLCRGNLPWKFSPTFMRPLRKWLLNCLSSRRSKSEFLTILILYHWMCTIPQWELNICSKIHKQCVLLLWYDLCITYAVLSCEVPCHNLFIVEFIMGFIQNCLQGLYDKSLALLQKWVVSSCKGNSIVSSFVEKFHVPALIWVICRLMGDATNWIRKLQTMGSQRTPFKKQREFLHVGQRLQVLIPEVANFRQSIRIREYDDSVRKVKISLQTSLKIPWFWPLITKSLNPARQQSIRDICFQVLRLPISKLCIPLI